VATIVTISPGATFLLDVVKLVTINCEPGDVEGSTPSSSVVVSTGVTVSYELVVVVAQAVPPDEAEVVWVVVVVVVVVGVVTELVVDVDVVEVVEVEVVVLSVGIVALASLE